MKLKGCGDVIRDVRQRRGFTTDEVEAILNWPSGRLSKYENNKLNVHLDVLNDLAQALEVSRAWLALLCLRSQYPELDKGMRGSKMKDLLVLLNKSLR